METGTVIALNTERGVFILRLESGDCAVFELLDSIPLAVGHQIGGELDALGVEELTHLNLGTTFDAYGQSGPCSLQVARHLIAR